MSRHLNDHQEMMQNRRKSLTSSSIEEIQGMIRELDKAINSSSLDSESIKAFKRARKDCEEEINARNGSGFPGSFFCIFIVAIFLGYGYMNPDIISNLNLN